MASSSCEMIYAHAHAHVYGAGAASSVEAMAEAGRLQRGIHQSHEDELQVMAIPSMAVLTMAVLTMAAGASGDG